KAFLERHPQTVDSLLAGNLESIDWLNNHPQESATEGNTALKTATGKELRGDVIERTLWERKFSADPLATTFPKLLQDGVTAGVGQQAALTGIFDLAPLNQLLSSEGKAEVFAGGLD